ncbi:MAG: hypothetical protein DSZ21_01765 [Tenericutes bacterium]|nr:MAG: hypothetical protein DSZ21_01765 [Mycoplasmatota bacterium]
MVLSFDNAREELNNKMDKMLFTRMREKKNNQQLFNESLYEGKIVDENKVRKIERKDLFELEKKHCVKLFGQDKPEEVLLDLNAFKELKRIYELNSNSTYPFKDAANEENYILLNTNGTNRKIRKIRVLGATKDKSEVIFAPNNGTSFYDTMG